MGEKRSSDCVLLRRILLSGRYPSVNKVALAGEDAVDSRQSSLNVARRTTSVEDMVDAKGSARSRANTGYSHPRRASAVMRSDFTERRRNSAVIRRSAPTALNTTVTLRTRKRSDHSMTSSCSHGPCNVVGFDKQPPDASLSSEVRDAAAASTSILRSVLLGAVATPAVKHHGDASSDRRRILDELEADSADTLSRRQRSLSSADEHLFVNHVMPTHLAAESGINTTYEERLGVDDISTTTENPGETVKTKRRGNFPADTLSTNVSLSKTEYKQERNDLAVSGEGCRFSSSPSRVLPIYVVISASDQKSTACRVSGWLDEISRLGGMYQLSLGLSDIDIARLLRHSARRLLLLYMAEADFRFNVEPARDEQETCATVQSVQEIRYFIAKCVALDIDSRQYHCMRLTTLFHPEVSELEHPDVVRRVNDLAGGLLRSLCADRCAHTLSSTMTPADVTRRYADLLLQLRQVNDVDEHAFSALFCRQLSSTICQLIKDGDPQLINRRKTM